MFSGREQHRLSVLTNWVIENAVTEIEMSERQFWAFVPLQSLAEKPVGNLHGTAASHQ